MSVRSIRSTVISLLVLAVGLACSGLAAAETAPATVSYTLPTDGPLPQTYRVTLAITAPDNPDWIVSTFVGGAARTVTAENQGKFTETWDGLDENYMPAPPGSYGVKGIYMPARKWEITGEYHSLIPKLAAGVGDSWFPTRDQDTKSPWFWAACEGAMLDISVAPADSGRNGIAAMHHTYMENAWNPFLIDLNKPIGHGQILAASPVGAPGGWASATDGELIWCLTDWAGIPYLYRPDGKPFGTGHGGPISPRRNVYVPRGDPTSIAAWRDPATGKRYVYLAQETLDPADLPWQFVLKGAAWRSPDWKPTENSLVILNGEDATELGRVPIAHPRQLQVLGGKLYALQHDGGQWKVSALALNAGMPQGEWQPVATIQGIDKVTDCKLDAKGNLYVSDRTGNQVYKLDPQGRIVHRFGRATRQTPGHYDEQVFMAPGKLALWTDKQGQERLLVIETAGPNRMSEWTTDGRLLRQWFCGNLGGDNGYCADPEIPEHIYTGAHSGGVVRYKVDYATGAWTVDAVWPDIGRDRNKDAKFPGGFFRPRLVNLQGRKYLVCARTSHDPFGVMVYRQQGDDWVPSAALIPGKTDGHWTDGYWWHDANGDGQLQPEEYQNNPTTLPGIMRWFGEHWLDDLSFVKLQPGTPDAWRIAPAGFDTFGNPIYDGKGWTKLLTDTVYAARKAGTADALHGANELGDAFGWDWQMIDGSMQEGFYVNARAGGFNANSGGECKISRYIPDGKGGFRMKWRVGRIKYDPTTPGQIYGSIYVTNPVNGLVGIQDSAGFYQVYSEDGLFVDTLFVDSAVSGVSRAQGGTYWLSGENFGGTHFLNRKNGKVYVSMACNQPCTLFEIDGWGKDQSPVRRLTTVDKQVTIASAQIAAPLELALKIRGGAGAARVARFLPAPGGGPALDGSLTGWEGCDPVTFRSAAKQSVEVRCMYDPGHLYLRWHARFAGKFAPRPLAPVENIFSGGRGNDTVSFYLQGDPAAKPGGPTEGRPGDVRIVFGVFQDGEQLRPVALGLYPKWFGPGKANPFSYASPVGVAKFEHVGLVAGATLGYALDADGQGWTLAARLPKAAFPKLPELGGGLRTLANFDANFGGHNKFRWANSDNSADSNTWDEPSEAGLYPGSWAPAQWVGLDQMYVHVWNVIGPFGFAGLPALRIVPANGGRETIEATLAATKYPPEEKVDLAATYTGEMTQTVKTRTLTWKPVFEPENRFDFGKQLGWTGQEEGAAYAVTYLYSPTAAEIGLRFEDSQGAHAVRGWLNGQPLPLDPKSLPVAKLRCRIDSTQPVKLQAGWNELLLRYDFIWGADKAFGLRLDAKPETLWGLRFSATPPAEAKQ